MIRILFLKLHFNLSICINQHLTVSLLKEKFELQQDFIAIDYLKYLKIPKLSNLCPT
jgi:hypothetical protein